MIFRNNLRLPAFTDLGTQDLSTTGAWNQTANEYACIVIYTGDGSGAGDLIAANNIQGIIITSNKVNANSKVSVSLEFGGTYISHGIPIVTDVIPGDGMFTFNIANISATAIGITRSLVVRWWIIN